MEGPTQSCWQACGSWPWAGTGLHSLERLRKERPRGHPGDTSGCLGDEAGPLGRIQAVHTVNVKEAGSTLAGFRED